MGFTLLRNILPHSFITKVLKLWKIKLIYVGFMGVVWGNRGFIGIKGHKRIYSKNKGLFYSTYILGGSKKIILGGFYQYLVKLELLFNIPWTHMLCQKFIEWWPHGLGELLLLVLKCHCRASSWCMIAQKGSDFELHCRRGSMLQLKPKQATILPT